MCTFVWVCSNNTVLKGATKLGQANSFGLGVFMLNGPNVVGDFGFRCRRVVCFHQYPQGRIRDCTEYS